MKDRKIMWAALLAAAPLVAQAQGRVAVDSVGYDVAGGAIVITGSNFVGPLQRAPDVRIGPVAARVTYYVEGMIVVDAPAGLPAGHHDVVVTPAGERAFSRMALPLAVAVPYVIERPALFVRN